MTALRGLALASLVSGAALLLYGASRGEVRVLLVLIFPVVLASGWPATVGILLLMAALVLWFVGRIRTQPAGPVEWGETPRAKGGGIVLVGPIPVVWGSDRRMVLWALLAGLVVLSVWVAFIWLRR